jgi:hypothetical protein
MAEARSLSVKTPIVALAGGANGATTPVLDGDINVITTAATAADSVKLPASQSPGSVVIVRNSGAASSNVFPPAGGTINGAAADAALAVANAKTTLFIQVGPAGLTWVTLAGA